MILLLDTQVFPWRDNGHAALKPDARAMIEDAGNRVLVSTASV